MFHSLVFFYLCVFSTWFNKTITSPKDFFFLQKKHFFVFLYLVADFRSASYLYNWIFVFQQMLTWPHQGLIMGKPDIKQQQLCFCHHCLLNVRSKSFLTLHSNLMVLLCNEWHYFCSSVFDCSAVLLLDFWGFYFIV